MVEEPGIKKQRLVHSTHRIKESVLKALEKEANKRKITVSILVNNILENYVTSDMHFERLGFILVSKEFLRAVFSKIDNEEELAEIGHVLGQAIAKQYIPYFFPRVDSNSIVQYLELWFRRFESYNHTIQEHYNRENLETHYFTIIHDITMNYSIALKMILQSLIIPIIKNDIEFQNITSSAISFSFDLLRMKEQ